MWSPSRNRSLKKKGGSTSLADLAQIVQMQTLGLLNFVHVESKYKVVNTKIKLQYLEFSFIQQIQHVSLQNSLNVNPVYCIF